MKVLYVSHTATLGGGERSLVELLRALPGGVEALLATPPGELADVAPVRCIELPEVRATFGGGVVPGVGSVATAARVLRKVVRAERPDLVHANSLRAGLVACAALLEAPVIVSIRDCLPRSMRAASARRFVHARAALVLANSSYTARSFSGSAPMRVVHPPVDVERFASLPPPADARRRLDMDERAPVLGVVGQLTPWKGQDDAIRMLAALRPRHPDVALVLAGAVRFAEATMNNRSYELGLHALARELGVGEAVHFLGDRPEVAEVLAALDVLLVPSWEEPFGRVVVEALAAGVPVAATAVGGPAEILAGGLGPLLPPRRPEAWIDPLESLLADESLHAPEAVATRRARAERFSAAAHVAEVVEAYRAIERPLAGAA